MYKIKVAWGLNNAINAENDDPNGEQELTQFDGDPMYVEYSFKTIEEVDAFKFALREMDGYLSSYVVDKNERKTF